MNLINEFRPNEITKYVANNQNKHKNTKKKIETLVLDEQKIKKLLKTTNIIIEYLFVSIYYDIR